MFLTGCQYILKNNRAFLPLSREMYHSQDIKTRRKRKYACDELVRLTGVEPVRPYGHKHLKLASLPIPAQPHRFNIDIIL